MFGMLWCSVSLQINPLSILSNAFSKSRKVMYGGVCQSMYCSMMVRGVAIWSAENLSWQNPACSLRRCLSTAFFNLSAMIQQKILLVVDSSIIIPVQLHAHTYRILVQVTTIFLFVCIGNQRIASQSNGSIDHVI